MMMQATLIYVPYRSRLASSLYSTVNMPRTTRSRSPIGSEWRYYWSHDQEGRWYRVWFRATRVWLNSVCNSSTTSSSQPVEQPDAYEAQTIPHTVSRLNSFACLADFIGQNIRTSLQHVTKARTLLVCTLSFCCLICMLPRWGIVCVHFSST